MAFGQGRIKVGIIGAGFVGSTIAFTLMTEGIVSEIVLVDINEEKAKGEAMDLRHGASFVSPVDIGTGDYADCRDADIIIVTAGASQNPNESRLDLVKKNTEIFKDMIPKLIGTQNQDSILLIVTNPVDVLSYVAWKISGLPAKRVIGSGTMLDSSRFRYVLSQHCDIDARNIHGYIIGEHGDSEVAVWSRTNVAGILFEEFYSGCDRDCKEGCIWMDKEETLDKVKDAAYEIVEKKGATYYAIALAVKRIVKSITRNENSILTVSTLMEGQYGLNDVYLSLPCIVNENGIRKKLEPELTSEEEEALLDSAAVLQQSIDGLDL